MSVIRSHPIGLSWRPALSPVRIANRLPALSLTRLSLPSSRLAPNSLPLAERRLPALWREPSARMTSGHSRAAGLPTPTQRARPIGLLPKPATTAYASAPDTGGLDENSFKILENIGVLARYGLAPAASLVNVLRTGNIATVSKQLVSMGHSEIAASKMAQAFLACNLEDHLIQIAMALVLSESDALLSLSLSYDHEGDLLPEFWGRILTLQYRAFRNGITLSPEELEYLNNHNTANLTWIFDRLLLGAVSEKMVIEAMRNRYHLMVHLFGDVQKVLNTFKREIACIPLGDRYFLKLKTGEYEDDCGLQIELLERNGFSLGRIGFQYSDAGTEVVRYQGPSTSSKEMHQEMQARFHKFSGGVDPLPWLAYLVGDILLTQTQAQNNILRWITGERVVMGYPHLHASKPDHIRTLEDARGPWDGNPRHAEILAEYAALKASAGQDTQSAPARDIQLRSLATYVKVFQGGERRIAKQYDTTARNLGCRRKGRDAAWHRYTKDPAEFGLAIRHGRNANGQSVDPAILDSSIKATHEAMRTDTKFGRWLEYRGNTRQNQQPPDQR